ncbi:MAG TPA: nicotinate (nicotinamide) nucleotide adenylyltransferase [Polaromonas sp.]|uniref:nicotinate (nicotinamide) nucleotide adenylyltransferase n=1 Tax=Polaromonas sp. TaxID=1869339 RepID=UPI002D3E2172|nr:nicotinate (nicotinamide) nucleotide adenylyltransferase [Polaromonas sp.]HYW58695.1 nicotinate (nicotinamide) nucleotide adenylyltransferase [Polaromonas sp.]
MSAPAARGKKRMGEGPQKRIGVFGGSFDPPHKAHVALAEAAVEQLELAALYIVPTGQAWHKARVLSAPEHRLAMTQLAFADLPGVVVDDRELRREGPSFTIDTLEALQADHPGAQIYLIIGADQFAALENWHRWEDILDIAIICIANRVHPERANPGFDPASRARHAVLTLHLPLMAVSATNIRRQIGSGDADPEEIAQLVSEPVARYIERHRLYLSR